MPTQWTRSVCVEVAYTPQNHGSQQKWTQQSQLLLEIVLGSGYCSVKMTMHDKICRFVDDLKILVPTFSQKEKKKNKIKLK